MGAHSGMGQGFILALAVVCMKLVQGNHVLSSPVPTTFPVSESCGSSLSLGRSCNCSTSYLIAGFNTTGICPDGGGCVTQITSALCIYPDQVAYFFLRQNISWDPINGLQCPNGYFLSALYPSGTGNTTSTAMATALCRAQTNVSQNWASTYPQPWNMGGVTLCAPNYVVVGIKTSNQGTLGDLSDIASLVCALPAPVSCVPNVIKSNAKHIYSDPSCQSSFHYPCSYFNTCEPGYAPNVSNPSRNFTCTKAGDFFLAGGTPVECFNVNECAGGCLFADQSGAPCHTCSSNALCNDTVGSYQCTCKPGYFGNGFNCTTINYCNRPCVGTETPNNSECHNCPQWNSNNATSYNAVCFSLPGTFTCGCPAGFQGPNGTAAFLQSNPCQPINECSLRTDNCPHQNNGSLCVDATPDPVNTQNFFSCQCKQGYTNPPNCTDVNECARACVSQEEADNSLQYGCNTCDVTRSTCVNLVGATAFCNCSAGYAANVTTGRCYDIDECATNPCGVAGAPAVTCLNLLNKYECMPIIKGVMLLGPNQTAFNLTSTSQSVPDRVLVTIKPRTAGIFWDGTISYGPAQQARAFSPNCTGVNSTTYICFMAAGAGANLAFSITSCLIANGSSLSCPTMTTVSFTAFRFSYPPPTLTNNSLCSVSGSCGTNINASYHDMVTMNGTNFINSKDLAKVTFTSAGNTYNCDIQTVSFTSISCVPESVFVGSNFQFYVSIGAGSSSQSVLGSDKFSFVSFGGASVMSVAPANISTAQGCTVSNRTLVNCPCVGGVDILVTSNLPLVIPTTLTVDGAICGTPTFVQNTTTLKCTLPAGVGDLRPVFFTLNGTIGPSDNLVSYQGPVITNIYSDGQCSPGADNLTLINCPRNGTGSLYLAGRNFGQAGALVLTNFRNIKATHLTSLFGNPSEVNGLDSYLKFDLPPGSGTQAVIVFQQNGKGSTTQVTYSYEPCVPGTFLFTDLTCRNCAPGTISVFYGSTSCANCPSGFEQPEAGKNVCKPCSPGRAANTTGMANCTSCGLGTKAPTPQSVSCLPCSPGTFAASSGLGECSLCIIGRAANASGLSTCYDCVTGTYASGTAQSSCQRCSVGTFAESIAQAACAVCSAGKYQNITGQTSCIDCQNGTYTDLSTTKAACFPCLAGSYAHPNRQTCVRCELGRYQNSSTGPQTACLDCPLGTVAGSTGLSSCTPCEGGHFMNKTGGQTCTPCDAGFFLLEETLPKLFCQACDPGTHSPVAGSAACTNCSIGNYQPASNASACIQCSPGKFASAIGGTACGNCPKGYSQPVPGQPDCVPCPAGLFTPDIGTPTCQPCQPGYFSVVQALGCFPCELGSYQNEFGKPNCILCAPGKFNNAPNASTCQLCAAGSFSNTLGAQTCAACPLSTSSVSGKTVCSSCAAGTYASNEGQPQCYQCPNGAHVDKYLVACSCPVGSYSLVVPSTINRGGNFTAYVCVECESGFVCLQEGLTARQLVEGPGYWRPLYSVDGTIYRCVNPSLCLGARQCQPNRVGPMCAICEVGYKASGPAGVCGLCSSDNSETWGYTIGIIILVIFLLCIFYYIVLKVSSTQQVKLEKLALMRDEQSVQAIEELQKEFAVDDAYFEAERAQFAGKNAGNTEETNVEVAEEPPQQEVSPEDEHRITKAASDRALIALRGPGSYKSPILAIGGGGRSSMAHIVRPGEKGLPEEVVNEGSTFRLKHISMASRRAPNFMYKVKILVGFFQIASILPLQGEIAWPTAFTQFISVFSILNFDFIPWQSLTCATSITYFGRAMIVGCIPIAVVIALVLFFYVPMYLRDLDSVTDQMRKQHKRNSRNRQFIRLLLFTVFLLYPFVSKIVLGVYNCVTVEGISYLVADFELRCFDSTWSMFAGICVIFVVLYPVGIPLIYYFILRRSYTRLHEPAVILQFGFLYEAYTDQRWFWELVDLIHKLILTSIVIFARSAWILGINMFVIGVYLVMILLFHPYIRKGDDRFHLLTQTELFLLALVGYIIQQQNIVFMKDPAMDALLSACLIVLVLFLMLSFIVIAGRNVYKIWVHAQVKKQAKKLKAETEKPAREVVQKTPEPPKARPAALEL